MRLGTGPLVDPGFEGKLLIPLHNLTSSEYAIDINEALIWIEFTKTTFGCKPCDPLASERRRFVPFPDNKKNLRPNDYLSKARPGASIRSSIPDAIAQGQRAATDAAQRAADAEQRAEDAKGAATSMRNWTTGIGVVGVLAIGVGLVTLYEQTKQLVLESESLTRSVAESLTPLTVQVESTINQLKSLQHKTSDDDSLRHDQDKSIEERMLQMRNSIADLQSAIARTRADLDALEKRPLQPTPPKPGTGSGPAGHRP